MPRRCESAPWIKPAAQGAMLLWLWLVILLTGCGRAAPQPAAMPTPPPPSPVAKEAPEEEAEAAPEPAWKRPFLWRIEGARPSYVLGTIHLPDERLEVAPDAVLDALNEVDAVITEAPMDELDDAKALLPKLTLPKGQSLDRLLPKAVAARARQAVEARGLPWERVSTFKLWVITAQLAMGPYAKRVDSHGDAIPSLDTRLFNFAKNHGKAHGGIETVDEQLGAFDAWTMDEHARWLVHALDDLDAGQPKTAQTMEAILAAFFAGDDDAMATILRQGYDSANAADKRLLKRLFTDRNVVMAERIAKSVRAKKSCVFAVGAGHVVGEGSVVALLKARGFKLTRVEEAEADASSKSSN